MSSMKIGGDIIEIPGSGKYLNIFTMKIIKHETVINQQMKRPRDESRNKDKPGKGINCLIGEAL